jgi:hypothetical protein
VLVLLERVGERVQAVVDELGEGGWEVSMSKWRVRALGSIAGTTKPCDPVEHILAHPCRFYSPVSNDAKFFSRYVLADWERAPIEWA